MAKKATTSGIVADILAAPTRRGGVPSLFDQMPDGPAKGDCFAVREAFLAGDLSGVPVSHAWRTLQAKHPSLEGTSEGTFRSFVQRGRPHAGT